MKRKFINCILYFTVFSVLISESSTKISNFESASCICFKSKLSNEFVSTMSIRRSNRLTLLLIECSESSACCRRFTLSSENFSRHRSSKMLWNFKSFNIFINVSISDAVLNRTLRLFQKDWSKSSSSFVRNSRARRKS